MKKIKILNYLVIVTLLINVVWFTRNLFHLDVALKIVSNVTLYEYSFMREYGIQIHMFFTFLFIIGIFLVQRGLYNIVKKGFFNNKSKSLFRKGGILFIISGLCPFIINVVIPVFEGRNFFEMFIGNDFLTLTIGLSIYLTADLIQDGSLLKQENELTI